ncbi:hypothetical protein RFI_18364, partial [Reticulomyxa filosa]
WFQLVVYNIAYTLALYGLMLFYMAVRSDIRAFSPVRKFFAVKIVIFATYWQGLAVTIAPGMTVEHAMKWNDFILCVEMSVFAFIHMRSFPWWEFKTGIPEIKDRRDKMGKGCTPFLLKNKKKNKLDNNKVTLGKHNKKVLSFKDVGLHNRFFFSQTLEGKADSWQALQEKAANPSLARDEEHDDKETNPHTHPQHKQSTAKKTNEKTRETDLTPSDTINDHAPNGPELQQQLLMQKTKGSSSSDEHDNSDDVEERQWSDEESDGLMQGKWAHITDSQRRNADNLDNNDPKQTGVTVLNIMDTSSVLHFSFFHSPPLLRTRRRGGGLFKKKKMNFVGGGGGVDGEYLTDDNTKHSNIISGKKNFE